MVNYKRYKINRILEGEKHFNILYLDGEIEWKNGSSDAIFVLKSRNFQEGDCIEIDIDKTYNYQYVSASTYYKDISMVRKISDKLSNLEAERDEWKRKFYDKNRDYEDYKEKYEDAIKEINRLKDEKLRDERKNTNEKSKLEKKNFDTQNENTRLQERLESSNARVIDLTRRLENKEEEVNVVRREKENQAIMFENKLDKKAALLETVRQSLKDLEIKHERENAAKDIKVGEKDSKIREKEKELKQKEEEVKISQKQAGQSREKLLSERVRLKYSKLEIFANQIEINLQQVDDLCRYCKRLVHAQKNFNQANIETHESNIVKVREGLRQRGLQIEDIQKFCYKCEKIAQMRVEINEIRQQQSQYEARQETIPLYNNRIN